MLKAFVQQSHGLTIVPLPASLQIPAEAIWLDLLDPTPAEEKAVEDFLRIDVPTREEMKEIETSNRLYEENGALYMTVQLVANMTTHRCAACGHDSPLFDDDGARRLAEAADLPVWADVPFDARLAHATDAGTPWVLGGVAAALGVRALARRR